MAGLNFFIFLKSPKVINFLLEVLEEIVTSGDSCKSKSRCCRLIPTYLPTYVVCGPIVDSFGSNGVGKTCLIKVCSRTSDDNRVTKILFTFQLNWSSWWSNFLSRIFFVLCSYACGHWKTFFSHSRFAVCKIEIEVQCQRLVEESNVFFKNGPTPASFCLFSFFSSTHFNRKKL